MKKRLVYISFILSVVIILTSFSSAFAKKVTVKLKTPTASNVSISGEPKVSQTISGIYTYSDENGDPEGQSKYRWLSSSTQTGTYAAIANATSKTYALTQNDIGKYIKFEVQPISTKSPYEGLVIQSVAFGPITSNIVIPPQPEPTPSKVVLGFVTKYYSKDTSSYNSMVANSTLINQIATVTYTADAYGNLSGTAPLDQIEFANKNGIKPLAMIANNFDSSIAKSILENSTYKQNFISNVLNAIKANNYSGINLDFEGISPTNRDAYSNLIIELKQKLSSLGYLFQVSVPAKASDSLTNAWSGAYDYKTIGQYADQVLLMTYDEHGSWSVTGPVASIGWVTNVVDYSLSVIPKEKLLLGLAAYGYD